jgi:hypothetical protein
MAQISIGIGTSHGPMLNTPPAEWGQRARADKMNKALAYRGTDYTFDELVAARAPGFAHECEMDVWERRHAACRAAIAELGTQVWAANVDVLVVMSSDHKETFDDELLPQFAVYWGDTVQHEPFSQEDLDAMPPGLAIAEVANAPEVSTTRKCNPELALHIIKSTSAAGFDPGASKQLPAGKYGDHGIPHGWGFVYQQILGGSGDIPFVPIFVNTFWEPNPPSASRCYDFGVALGEAIASFPQDLRVGVVASGGLSHFVIDEELDEKFIESLINGDEAHMRSLQDEILVSGTSELRNWVTVAGAVKGANSGLKARVVDYQPCYRSEAGTGNAMGFMVWDGAQA